MSLFRKPKKIQRRVFTADDDEDEKNEEPQAPPPPMYSKQAKKKDKQVNNTGLLSFGDEINSKKKDKSVKATALLSFADEEEDDGEVFKVKKSKQSNRLAKRREKERRRGSDGDSNKNNADFDNNFEPNTEENAKPKKKTLEGLILSGREALAADGAGDLSEEEQEGGSPGEENRGFHQYRAETVRAALAVGGHIPDAALIHAARKTRQQARELGGDYIPVTPSEAVPGSRLVRDDGSGDEDEDGRIEVRGLELPSDKPKRGTVAVTNEELDSEPDEWEEQQIKKAMPVIPDISGDIGVGIGIGIGVEMNPFASAPPPPPPPPPPRLEAAPAHLRALPAHLATAGDLCHALRQRLQELETDRDVTSAKKQELKDRLLNAARIRESRSARCSALDAAYKRAQAARGYLTDLIECLDEKMPQLEALEGRALALHRRRCEFLMERRRADVRDQAQDVLAMAARPGSTKPVDSEDKIRRAAEREGRRRARRLAREAAAASANTALRHRDGDSSDDEPSPQQRQYAATETQDIRQQSAALFSDALPAWRGVRGVCGRLARWRARDPAAYTDAYVADCLPKLLAPYVRHELILWNPLADEDNEDYERMEWYRCLMMYGVKHEPGSDSDSDSDSEPPRVTEESIRSDPDLMLVPTILAKVVLPKVTELIEHAWDPMCVRACIRLRQLIVRASGTVGAGQAMQKVAAAVYCRLHSALQADVFLPALPPQIMEGAGGGGGGGGGVGGGGAFWRRCLGAGVRLLRSALALTAPPALLRADPIVLALIETLCCAAGASPPQSMSFAALSLAETLPRSGELRAKALQRIAKLASLALSRLESDNPMHLKALEQARNVIAESKAMESQQ